MKNKIKNVFKIGIIIIIFLAFVMPGVATTENKLSEENLDFADATFDWVPVSASGLHTIVGNEIILHETGQIVTLEIYVSGWSPKLLKTVQATVDSSKYSNGVGGTLIPYGWPGTPENGCFIDTSRTDFVFYGMVFLDAVSYSALDYMWGATLLVDAKADGGLSYYLGTLILDIPATADGTYYIDFIDGTSKTFMKDDGDNQILPIITTPAVITINHAPNKPATPSGPTNGKVGTSYTYTTNCIDPDGDFVDFWFDWGDGHNSGWVGPFASGAPGSASYTWTSQGNYNILVKAKDSKGIESIWSDALTVTMPRSKAIQSTPFLNFLQCYPYLFPLLQKLIQNLGL
jgi:hypothetical protein